jgi:twitching motility protein PilI
MTGSMPGPEHNLRSLRDRPFELLKELEKRSRNVGAGSAPESPSGQEWVGVAFRMGGETFLVAREETREVLGYPAAVTRIPGAKSTTTPGRNSRIIVVNHREIPAGLVVDEVLGFRRFTESEFNAEPPPTVIRCESYLAGAFRRGGEVWPVLGLKGLVESQSFLQAAS